MDRTKVGNYNTKASGGVQTTSGEKTNSGSGNAFVTTSGKSTRIGSKSCGGVEWNRT